MTSASYSTPPASLSLKTWRADEFIMTTTNHDNHRDFKNHEISTQHTDEEALPIPVQASSIRHSISRGRGRQKSRVTRPIKRFWRWFIARTGGDDVASTIATSFTRDESIERERVSLENLATDGHTVNVVVVDREWGVEGNKKLSSTDDRSPELKSSASPDDSTPVTEGVGVDLLSRFDTPPWWHSFWRPVYHQFSKFFVNTPPNMHADLEARYSEEDWRKSKKLAWWASLWLIINWALGVAAVVPRDLADKIFHYGVAPTFSIPILLMVMADMPMNYPFIYQCFLAISTWMWAFYYVLYMYLCGFYSRDKSNVVFQCLPGKDFQGVFYYTVALQTISLFGLKLNRFAGVVGSFVFLVFAFVTIVPDREIWWRNLVNFAVFHCFLLFIHYRRECADRNLYQTQNELKVQIKRRQKAQQNERRASEGKRRLTSYVFHEVRVPLNIALLAAQNLESAGTIVKDLELEFHALKASLDSMTQVLNDVLDFNRMDSGHFEIADKPFPLHKALKSLHFPLQLAAESRGQRFVMKLDPNIDRVARTAAYKAMGQSKEAIRKRLERYPDVSGVVIGDESRLRQIVTNFASNACKFTPKDGTISISTSLVLPRVNEDGMPEDEVEEEQVASDEQKHNLSTRHVGIHNGDEEEGGKEIVVRIEVQDTGCGITAQEMGKSKLFSAFNQTTRGKEQGGTGTGLGLALVRNIAIHSRARLGVKSEQGVGSTFWLELALRVGKSTLPKPLPGPATSPTSPVPPSTASETVRMDRAAVARAAAMQLKTPLMKQTGTGPRESSRHSPHASLHSTVSTPQTGISDPFSAMFIAPASQSTMPGSRRNSTSSIRDSREHEQSPLRMTTLNTDSLSTSFPSTSDTNPMDAYDQMFDLATPEPSPSTLNPTPLPKSLNVLVVDDDVLTRSLMNRMLSRLDQNVTLAENGKIAAEKILGPEWSPVKETFVKEDEGSDELPIAPRPSFSRMTSAGPSDSGKGPYDVVFLDNQMPVLSGLETVRQLRGLGRNDFIVGLTGNALQTDQDEFLQAGVDIVLTKPVREASIKEVLMKAQAKRKRLLRLKPQEKPVDVSTKISL